MFCRNCGAQVGEQAAVCPSCGTATGSGKKFCTHCGAEADPAAVVCVKCGVSLVPAAAALKSKLVAGLLGIFVGGLGIHRFYLGYNLIGIIQLCVTVALGIITCGVGALAGHLWGLIEGILILTGQINKDAQGRPLAE
jgi:TM2 domain-containing membrane protein YozV/ribosomal protein L40E